MKNIIFLGGFYSPNLLAVQREQSMGKLSFANHNFELSLVSGLIQQPEINLTCITAPGVGSYPHNNTNFFTRSEYFCIEGQPVKGVGFCNLMVVNKLHMMYGIIRALRKAFKSCEGNDIKLIVNTATVYLLVAVRIATLLCSRQIKIALIIPDIPSMMTSTSSNQSLKIKIRSYIDRIGMKLMQKLDYYVLLSEQMMDFLPSNAKHIVMEGIVNPSKMDVNTDGVQVANREILLYTGSIQKIYGIMNLVQAFGKIYNKDIELWICGAGDAKTEIEEQAQNDSRIKFYGLVDSQKSWEMQRQVSILINPRTSDGEYTKYSFPSKTMEYLLSGKSVIINKLPCIPKEYFDYVFTPKDESVDALADEIIEVLAMNKEERNARAAAGRRFIIEKKNSKAQVSRIINLINK